LPILYYYARLAENLKEEKTMRCVICKHRETQLNKTTMTLERNETIIVFKNVPAEVCEICGEAYTDAETTDNLLRIFEEAMQKGVQVQVRFYTAV